MSEDRWQERVKLVEKRAEFARRVLEGAYDRALDLDEDTLKWGAQAVERMRKQRDDALRYASELEDRIASPHRVTVAEGEGFVPKPGTTIVMLKEK